MDPKDAKKLLVEHSNALNVLLHKEGLKDVESKDVDADETLGSIEDRDEKLSFIRKALKKVQKIPVVETFSNLGVAGSVAVTSAAVTQTEIAKNTTEVFVAEVAEDIVQERIEPPAFIDNFVDFDAVYNNWGEQVIAQKFVNAQSYTENVSEQIQSKIETGEIEVSIPKTVSSDSSDDSNSSKQPNKQEQKLEIKEEVKQVKESSEEEIKKTNDEEKAKEDTKESEQEEETEDELESQEEPLEEKVKGQAEEVKEELNSEAQNESRQSLIELPRVVTPENDTTIVSPVM